MTEVTDPRRLATARLALDALEVLPPPRDPPVYTGWVAWRLGIPAGGFDRPTLLRALNRLARLGLAERQHLYGYDCGLYWRRTIAGHLFDGEVADIARNIRHNPGRSTP